MSRPPLSRLALCSAIALGAVVVAWACSNYYINSLLEAGDESVLRKPATRFAASVEKLAPKTERRAVTADEPATESATACIHLLHTELFLDKSPKNHSAAETALRQYAKKRENLVNFSESGARRFIVKLAQIGSRDFSVAWTEEFLPEKAAVSLMDNIDLPETVPAEFSHYLVGAIAWQGNDTPAAVQAWERVLALPEAQRTKQGVFAAYMLGVAAARRDGWGDEVFSKNMEEARRRFQQVRQLAAETKNDPCGLAVASLGQEARTYFLSGGSVKNYSQAASLYLEQAAANDPSAVPSLQRVVRRMLDDWNEEILAEAAKDSVLRPLVSLYITSEGGRWGVRPSDVQAQAWIRALELSDVVDGTDAARLALLCYQQGEYVSCARWIQKAPESYPLTRWLMARLLLREGKTREAATLLATLVREQRLKAQLKPIPVSSDESDFSPVAPWRYEYGLTLEENGSDLASRIVAEQGVLAMGTQDYTEALDAFLRTELYGDAAYVAEYVLSARELKAYVDATWSATDKSNDTGAYIRHLLAKRFLRERRWQEARDYFPASVHEIFDQYVAAVQQAYNFQSGTEKRAEGFWKAAVIVFENGEALFFAEAGPRWSVYTGWRDTPAPQEARLSRQSSRFTAPTQDELTRVESRSLGKEDRDRRYRAAELAGYAAALLPNDDPRTARILATAGTWLKYREPRAAEPFYKQLVIRCPNTELGKRADKLRWFPPEVTGVTAGIWDGTAVLEVRKPEEKTTPPTRVEESSEAVSPNDPGKAG